MVRTSCLTRTVSRWVRGSSFPRATVVKVSRRTRRRGTPAASRSASSALPIAFGPQMKKDEPARSQTSDSMAALTRPERKPSFSSRVRVWTMRTRPFEHSAKCSSSSWKSASEQVRFEHTMVS